MNWTDLVCNKTNQNSKVPIFDVEICFCLLAKICISNQKTWDDEYVKEYEMKRGKHTSLV